MAETKARFLANLIGADNTANDFTLPNVAVSGTNDKVLTSGGDGTVTWETPVIAPTITNLGSSKINEDTSTTVTVNGSGFTSTGMTASLTDTNGADITNHTNIAVSYVSESQITFNTTTNTNNISAGTVVKVKITKSGLTTISQDTITVNADPTWNATGSITTTLSDKTGTSQNVGSPIQATAGTGGGTVEYATTDTSFANAFVLNSSTGQVTTHGSNSLQTTAGITTYTGTYTETFEATASITGDSTRVTPATFTITVVNAKDGSDANHPCQDLTELFNNTSNTNSSTTTGVYWFRGNGNHVFPAWVQTITANGETNTWMLLQKNFTPHAYKGGDTHSGGLSYGLKNSSGASIINSGIASSTAPSSPTLGTHVYRVDITNFANTTFSALLGWTPSDTEHTWKFTNSQTTLHSLIVNAQSNTNMANDANSPWPSASGMYSQTLGGTMYFGSRIRFNAGDYDYAKMFMTDNNSDTHDQHNTIDEYNGAAWFQDAGGGAYASNNRDTAVYGATNKFAFWVR